jgi:hypothetical protein
MTCPRSEARWTCRDLCQRARALVRRQRRITELLTGERRRIHEPALGLQGTALFSDCGHIFSLSTRHWRWIKVQLQNDMSGGRLAAAAAKSSRSAGLRAFAVAMFGVAEAN